MNFRESWIWGGFWVFAALMSSSLGVQVLQDGESEPGQGPELIQCFTNRELCTVYC